MEAMQAAQAAARARYAQAASAFAPLSADNLAPQMQLFIERCETLYGASPPMAAPPPHAYTSTLTPRRRASRHHALYLLCLYLLRHSASV